MIINIEAPYVRHLGSLENRYAQSIVEIRQFITYRLLGNPDYVRLMGSEVYELQTIVRRIDEQLALMDGDINDLRRIADSVEGLTSGLSLSPSWAVPAFFSPAVIVGAARFLPTIYRSVPSLTNIGRVIYSRYAGVPYSPATQLAGGSYVNVYRRGPYVNVYEPPQQGPYVNVYEPQPQPQRGPYVNVVTPEDLGGSVGS